MDKQMRRKEKAISPEESLEVLRTAEYGVLSTVSADQTPYATPMSFVLLNDAIYFHCAKEGHRLENIAGNRNVCFNVVDSVKLMPANFNTQYRSVTVSGTIRIVEEPQEKKQGICAIVDKLSPDHKEAGLAYIDKAFNNMHVLKLQVSKISGKATRG